MTEITISLCADADGLPEVTGEIASVTERSNTVSLGSVAVSLAPFRVALPLPEYLAVRALQHMGSFVFYVEDDDAQ